MSSKKYKTGGDEEDTIEHEKGGALSNKTNAKNPKLSLLD